jgi:peroxiredoxin
VNVNLVHCCSLIFVVFILGVREMTIQVGDKVPAVGFSVMTGEGPKPISSEEIFSGKKVVFFAVPGAFTPGCSMTHLPGFVVDADALKAKGADTIACMSVNDAFVMGAWGAAQNAEEILMLADGNADFTKALGLELDASGFGMGVRAQRFGMIVEDGTVTYLGVEAPGEIKVSSSEAMLAQL